MFVVAFLSTRPVNAADSELGISQITPTNVSLNLDTAQIIAGKQTIVVQYSSSSAEAGYRITLSSASNSVDLVSDSATEPIRAITGANQENPAPLTPGTWGYAIPGRGGFNQNYIENTDESSLWAAMPMFGSGEIIAETGSGDGSGMHSYDIWFAARSRNEMMMAGEYTAQIVYTVVANPVEPAQISSISPSRYNLGDVTVPARVTISGANLISVGANGNADVCIAPTANNPTDCGGKGAVAMLGIVGSPTYTSITVDLPNDPSVIQSGEYFILVRNSSGAWTRATDIFQYTETVEITGISPSSYDLDGDLPIEMVGGAGDTSNNNGLHTQTHQVILTESGQVFAWGANDNGQLGTGDNNDRDTPFNITDRFNSGDDKIVQVSTKGDFNIALTQSGQVYAWGSNYCGQLGNGDTGPCAGDREHATPDLSKYVNTPTNITSQFGLPAGRQIVSIKAGWRQAFAIDNENNLYAWGANYSSQLGLGVTGGPISKPTMVSFDSVGGINGEIIDLATDSHTLVLTDAGHVYVWGYNYYGQLGNGSSGDQADSNQPIDITDRFNGEKIIQVEASSNGSIALTEDGKIYAWGENTHGNLGFNEGLTDSLWIHGDIRSEEDHIQPITPTLASTDDINGNITELVAGFSKTLAITDSGHAYVWGENSGGQLGIANDEGDSYKVCSNTLNCWSAETRVNKRKPTLLAGYSGESSFVSISASADSLFAIGANGHIYSWGLGGTPQQGDVTGSVNHELMVIRGANLSPNNNTASRVFIDFVQANGQFDTGEQCQNMTINAEGSRITCDVPVGDGGVNIPEGSFDVYVELADGTKLKSPVQFRYYR